MGRAITFMIFVWIVVSLAGGVVAGDRVTMATTSLVTGMNDSSTGDITVAATEGFPDSGFIDILGERIGYASKTGTTFKGNPAQPIIRGAQDTDATDHAKGEKVRTTESNMLNQSLSYKLAVVTDSSGPVAFVTVPFALISLLASFFTLPLSFLGTDLEILTYIWVALSIGLVASLALSVVGGRFV